jgi:predicted O-methyltransferase YrrM
MTLKASDMEGEEWAHYPGEVVIMHALAEALPTYPIIINIGTGFGTSCLAFYEARPNAVIFAIDRAPCDRAAGHWEDADVEPGRIIRVRGRSQDVGRYWPMYVNLVLIDGGHKTDDVWGDILAWESLIQPGGLLVFHDYDNPVCAEVKPVVDKWARTREPWLQEGYFIAFQMKGE